MRRIWCSILSAALLLAACDSTGPKDEQRDETDLTFVRLAAGQQTEVTQASFWAVRGQTRTLTLRYDNQAAGERPLLELTVGAQSLLTAPGGRPFLPGDSVLITVAFDAQRRLVFDLQPSGLVFSPVNPALLRIDYSRADADLNRDGVVNQLDAAVELQLRIWKQEVPGLPWLPVPTVKLNNAQVLEGRVTHFTGFAVAS